MADWPEFQVYNGATVNKLTLMEYLQRVDQLERAILNLNRCKEQTERRIFALEQEAKRRSIPLPTKEKPSGLSGRFGQKKREYERWLAEAPQRKAAWEEACRQEEQRVQDVNRTIEQLRAENEERLALGKQFIEKYRDLLVLHVLPPDYRLGGIPGLLLSYLMNNRADTLSQAISLYHEEQYREEMVSLAREQNQKLQAAMDRQVASDLRREANEAAFQHAVMQRVSEVADEATRTRKAAEEAAFYEKLNFWSQY